MTATVVPAVTAAVLAAAAVGLLVPPASGPRRVHQILDPSRGGRAGSGGAPPSAVLRRVRRRDRRSPREAAATPGQRLRGAASLRRIRARPSAHPGGAGAVAGRRLAAGFAGLALLLVVGPPLGLVVAAAATVAVHHGLGLLEPAARRRDRRRAAADLPVAADLLAACVSAGATVEDAALAVADAIGGPLGQQLRTVVARVRLGGDPGREWQTLGVNFGRGAAGTPARDHAAVSRGPGPADGGVGAFGRAIGRAVVGGAPLAPALTRIADEQRAVRRAAAEAAARQAGVRAIGPLGACFLPAFVLVGVVPLVAGLALDAFAGR